MVILIGIAGFFLQIAIGYIVLKFIASVCKSVISSLVVPAVKAIFTLVWVSVKIAACLTVGGVVIIGIFSLIA